MVDTIRYPTVSYPPLYFFAVQPQRENAVVLQTLCNQRVDQDNNTPPLGGLEW